MDISCAGASAAGVECSARSAAHFVLHVRPPVQRAGVLAQRVEGGNDLGAEGAVRVLGEALDRGAEPNDGVKHRGDVSNKKAEVRRISLDLTQPIARIE